MRVDGAIATGGEQKEATCGGEAKSREFSNWLVDKPRVS
jgi:hypothetical protein